MPKIIKNLDEKIKKNALKLFSEHGYDEVDVKLIAKECGMAVGTFYNYYKSKKELFMDILENSWEYTFQELSKASELDIPAKEKIKKEIEILYTGIEERRGLGYYVHQRYTFNQEKTEDLGDFNQRIISRLKLMFKPFEKVESIRDMDDADERLAQTLILQITMNLSVRKDKKEENLKFIEELILGLLVTE